MTVFQDKRCRVPVGQVRLVVMDTLDSRQEEDNPASSLAVAGLL